MKKILLGILMMGALIGLVSDFIYLMNGATYTLLGVITALINIVIVGKGLDHIRG